MSIEMKQHLDAFRKFLIENSTDKISADINDWKSKLFCGLSKREIRDLSEGVFNEGYGIFGSLVNFKQNAKDNTASLRIELDNASPEDVTSEMGKNYANILSANSDTHKFIFKNYRFKNEQIDLSSYSPKIAPGKFEDAVQVYIIIRAELK